jgi:hypothetical protein
MYRLLLLTLLLFLLAGCKEERHVSAFLSENEGFARMACLDQESHEFAMKWTYPHAPEWRQQEISEGLEKAKEKCSTAVDIINSLSTSREELREGFSVPSYRYFIDVIDSDEWKDIIGLFDTSADCEAARERLLDSGFETSECYRRVVFLRSVWS